MSNHLAIATATTALIRIIDDALKVKGEDGEVRPLNPSLPSSNLPDKGVTVFLYQVTPNPGLRNNDLPTRNSDGKTVARPRLAIDLHYLLTFHGKDNTLEPQRLLGMTMSTLHAQPVLSRELIHKVIKDAVEEDPQHYLAISDLEYEPERVKFTMASLSLEELSKLWSVFFQTTYRLSVAYIGTVVLIDTEVSAHKAPPVKDRRIRVLPFRQPVIDSVSPQAVKAQETIFLKGQNLKGDLVKVVFGGGHEVSPADDKITDREIEIQLPAELRAGVNTVQVKHEIFFAYEEPYKTASEPHKGFESNIAAFMLRPKIAALPENVTTNDINDVTYCKGQMKVTFTPSVRKEQKVVLFLNRFNPPKDEEAFAYSFSAPPGNGITDTNVKETETINFDFIGVVKGAYLVRVRVDGGESEITQNADTKLYDSPKVNI